MARTAHNARACCTCGRLIAMKVAKARYCSPRCIRHRRRAPGKVERTKPKSGFNHRPGKLL